MYCKDCKFYKFDRTDQILDEKIDGSEVIKKIKRGKCSNSNLRYSYELEDESQLIYCDSEDWSAYLYVGEMFGCVHFKEKENIQKLLSNINKDLNILFDVVKHYKRIYEDKWINKDRYNSYQAMLMRMECNQLVYDCKKLLNEIEIHESKI
jgi:hypothetical protein